MPDGGLTTAAAATGIAGAAAGGAGSILSATQGPQKAVALPPELELQQLNLLETQIADFETERESLISAIGSLENIASIQEGVAQGLIPEPDAIKAITQQTTQLAQNFGDQIPGVIEDIQRDLSQLDIGLESDIRGDVDRLRREAPDEFKDPQVEREIEEGRQKLRDRLAAQFGPGFENTDAGIRALNAFEQGSTELRFDVSQRGRAEQLNRLGGLSNIAAQSRGSQLATIGGRQSVLDQFSRGRAGAVAELGQGAALGGQFLGQSAATTGAARDLGLQQLQLGSVPFGTLQAFGSQQISGATSRGLQSGLIGPGTLFQQTGIPEQDIKAFRDFTRRQERGQFRHTPFGSQLFPDEQDRFQF